MSHAAEIIHRQVFSKILRSPMSFFDTTPIGRITNRLSKDIDNTDMVIPQNFRIFFMLAAGTVSSLIIMCLSGWQVLIGILPLVLLFLLVQVWKLEKATGQHFYNSQKEAGINFLKKINVERI